MKKKLLFPTLFAASLFVLVGCGSTRVVPATDRSDVVAPTNLMVSKTGLALYTGESRQLEVFASPAKSYSSELIYTSSNSRVASVNKKGVITAKGVGVATITVTSALNPLVSKSLFVTVAKEVKNPTTQGAAAKATANKILNKQKELYPGSATPDVVIDYRTSHSVVSYDGVENNITRAESKLICSKSEGYFFLEEVSRDIKVAGGAEELDSGSWLFSCDKDYYVDIFHINGNVRTHLELPFQSMMSKPRIDVVFGILKSFFTTGEKMATDLFEDILSTSTINGYDASKATRSGYSEETLIVQNDITFTESDLKDDRFDLEQNWDVPYDSPLTLDQKQTYAYYDGLCKLCKLQMIFDYELDGKKAVTNFVRSEQFEVGSESDLVHFDKDTFSEVYSIYDL